MTSPFEKMTESLTDEQWATVYTIAHNLAKEQKRIDPEKDGIATELKKLVTYLYALVKDFSDVSGQSNRAGSKILDYLRILTADSKQVWRTGRTPDYYKCIYEVCTQTLKNYQNHPKKMLEILGWASRLIRYYKDIEQGAIVGEVLASKNTTPIIYKEINTQTYSKYSVEQIVDATVVDIATKIIDSKKTKTTVVYMLEGQRLAKPEEIYNMEKKGIFLKQGDIVQLKILEINDGRIKKFERC
jgi:hypothetical protein